MKWLLLLPELQGSTINRWGKTDPFTRPFLHVPLYDDTFGEAIVKEEDSDTGQLGDFAGFHSLNTAVLQDFYHTGPAPESLLPLHKYHGTWTGAEEQRPNHMLLLHSGRMSGVQCIHNIIWWETQS